jgi:hypothetical protein
VAAPAVVPVVGPAPTEAGEVIQPSSCNGVISYRGTVDPGHRFVMHLSVDYKPIANHASERSRLTRSALGADCKHKLVQ